MENASKALLLAGGILVSIIILSITVHLFQTYNKVGETYEKSLSVTEIEKHNNNFVKFIGRENITIQEIISVVNFTKQYKQQTEIDIKVYIGTNDLEDDNAIDLIENYSYVTQSGNTSIKYFKCEANNIQYNENGTIKLIKFT